MASTLVSILATAGSLLVLLASPALAADHKYIGVKDCSRCHKKELIGDQYGEWKKSPHAKAFETLKSEDALAAAKERGITTPPHESEKCLKCHATAQNVTKAMTARRPLKISDGVQCESCHGPGSDYRKKKVMSNHDEAVAKGLWEPGKDEKICLACHNDESPTWDPAKGFDYEAAKKKIAHPIPEDVKGHYVEIEKERRKKRGGGDEDD